MNLKEFFYQKKKNNMLHIPSHLLKYESKIQQLLIKSSKKVEEANPFPFKYMNEYYDTLSKYVNEVFKMIIYGIALELKVNPKDLKKSIRISIGDLIKVSTDDGFVEENYSLLKTFFDKYKNKYSYFDKWMKTFNLNRGKKLEPLKFKNKFVYNPVTKKPLTNQEWDNITNDIVDFLGDKLNGANEEMFVRAGLMGKIAQKIEDEGIPLKKQKQMTYDYIAKQYGKIPQTLEEAVKKYKLNDEEKYAIEYAKQRAAEYLSIKDGKLKNKIISSVRNTIVEGMREGLNAQQMTQRLFWADPSDKLGKQFTENTIEAWNRDWRRIAVTSIKEAQANGYLMAQKAKAPTEKVYVVYSGSNNPKEGNSEPCNKFIGKIYLLVDEPRNDDRIKDSYASHCTWIGKNTIGMKKNVQWGAIPQHPSCRHYWEKIDPTIMKWDDESGGIVYKED